MTTTPVPTCTDDLLAEIERVTDPDAIHMIAHSDMEALLSRLRAAEVDAAKFAVVKNAMDQLQADERDGAMWTTCALILISIANKIGSARSVVTEEGVTFGDDEIGDWRVTVERIDAAMQEASQ